MVGKVINLNRYRKQKAKVDRKKQADVNRRLHGRTTAERAREELQKKQLTRAVEGAKLEPPAEASPHEARDDEASPDEASDDEAGDE
jgi:hypothetical protein